MKNSTQLRIVGVLFAILANAAGIWALQQPTAASSALPAPIYFLGINGMCYLVFEGLAQEWIRLENKQP